MSSIHNVLGGLKLSSLKKLIAIFPKHRKMEEESRALFKAKRDKIESMLPPDFSWAELYELNIKEMNILTLAATGSLDRLLQAAHAGFDLNQFLFEEAIRSHQDKNKEVEWSGGHGGLFTEADVFAVQQANQSALRCLGIYGHYLNELVSMVSKGGNGSDDAFFKAVTIDRTVLTCRTFAARLARAEFFGEKMFFLHLRKATKGKPHDSLLMHQDLRYLLQFFHEAGILGSLTLTDVDILFIRELKVYSDSGDDPARSLMRFIQRWKAEKHSAT